MTTGFSRLAFFLMLLSATSVCGRQSKIKINDCTLQYVIADNNCYDNCGTPVSVIQRIVTCPLLTVPCSSNAPKCPSPPSPMPPSPAPPSPPLAPSPPPYPPSPPPPSPSPPSPSPPPPPIVGSDSCSWFCNPCDTCKENPLNPSQCIYFGGSNNEDVGSCTITKDCIFGNTYILAGTDLNDVGALGLFASPPTSWVCMPGSERGGAEYGITQCWSGPCTNQTNTSSDSSLNETMQRRHRNKLF